MSNEIQLLNYINGKLIPPVSGNYFPVYNPSTGQVFANCPDSTADDVELAVESAKNAFKSWSKTSASDRGAILVKISALIEKNIDKLALAESIDNGKPVSLATRMDIPRAKDNFYFFGTAMEHFASESHVNSPDIINYTLRQPIGIVGCISPWNLPLYLFTWKIAPALAAGNCVVAKPSEITPYTSFLLSELCIEAGLPAGVLNIIHGNGPNAGNAIVSHPGIKAISFTGGTKTGAHIASVAAPMFKKLSLELGGKNPTLIFDDCDFDLALATTVRSAFTNQGQICLCGSRILVQESIYEKFKTAFVEKIKALKQGNPLDADTAQGAVVSKGHFEKVLNHIQIAKEEGAIILTGGKAWTPPAGSSIENGWYIEPTIIEGLPQYCRTNMEEIFGPVVTLQSFKTEEEALEIANATEYGLACSVFTTNLNRANRVSTNIQSGIVWINCWLERDLRTPFGGVKSSGVGREGGLEALRFFTEAKNVCFKTSDF